MKSIELKVVDKYFLRVKQAYLSLFPIPLIENPDYDKDNNNGVPVQIPEFSEGVWVKKCIIKQIKKTVNRTEERSAIDAAKKNIVVDNGSDVT